MQFRWAIVDCETTGLHPAQDCLTEISILIVTEKGVETHFTSLVKPRRRIPTAIESLTGIRNEMVERAPAFSEIAGKITAMLDGCIFVAHNARFDYGFLKNHLKRCEVSLNMPVLCTIKLFKKLYPQAPSFKLEELAIQQGLTIDGHHRAEADTLMLFQLLTIAQNIHGKDRVLEEARACQKKSSIPSRLETDISTLPETVGVYLFYGEMNDLPLYIGKSISLRKRILSHFQADHTDSREFALAQQTRRIECIPTAGELGALLLESELVKKHMPLYNRRLRRKKIITGFRHYEQEGYIHIEAVREERSSSLYGAFRSMRAAKESLLQLTREYGLCPKLCNLEQSKTACFAWQLKRCKGACVHEENPDLYNARVLLALETLKEEIWPFRSAIVIREECTVTNITQFMKFDQWRYLGIAENMQELDRLENIREQHDMDTYRILSGYIRNQLKPCQVVICD